jgi:eukaryotic-like serine/threonine-protein kinase
VDQADIVGERYRLERKIGQGGTGSIWLAHDVRLERTVAIKFLFARAPEQQERLAKRVALEAKLAASIQHPNVVQIFDFGTHESNIPYIVMEALSGYTLGAAFDATRAFSLDEVISAMSDVLRGLATVHDSGIVHRDLKPDNIFLVQERDDKLTPKLLDFGVSRSLEPDTRPSAVTTTDGMIIGTPHYMSPEQARGLRDIDKRTDIYSVGVVLFEALTGFTPFASENLGDLLLEVIRKPAPPLYGIVPQIGKPLCRVVDKALAKNRWRRFPDATAMAAALAAAAQQIPSTIDRKARLFPPPSVHSRTQPKLSGAEGAFSLSASFEEAAPIAAETRVGRGSSRLAEASTWSGASDAPTVDHVSEQTPAVAELGVSDRTTTYTGLRGWTTPGRWLTFAVASVGLVAVAVAATLAWTRGSSGRDDTGFIVVQAAAPPPSAAAPAQPSVALEAEPEPQTKPAPASKLKKPGKTEVLDPTQLMAADVARAFARQKAKVIGCLDAHPEDMRSAPQLLVTVTVTAAGKASSALLLPETIANKPVTGCVTDAVLSMRFPPQAQPTTFRIPLLWRRK